VKKLISRQGLAVLALLFSSTGFGATVLVTSSDPNPTVGTSFTLNVHGDGFPDTVGATLKLFFDDTKVAVKTPTTTAGILIPVGSPFTGGIVAPSPFLSGNILSVLAPTVGTLPTGSFDAFTISFTALAAGAANIVLTDDQGDFSWTDATTFLAIPVTYTQANVVVQGAVVPAPAAVWLLGTGVVALAGRRLRRRQAA